MRIRISPVAILNAFVNKGDCVAVRDIPYGEAERQDLDIYRPAKRAQLAPVVVYFYGGGWEEGDKALYPFLAATMVAHGLTVVVPDYRVYPVVRFPTFLEDAALAVRWVREHVARYGGDPERVVLMGHSAGAHIAAMLTFDRRWLAQVDLDPRTDVKGMIGLAGPYDFLPLRSATLKEIFGPEDRLAETQPINFVDGAAPPVFLATGTKDDSVKPGNSLRLAERIRANGGVATLALYRHVGHRTLVGAFAPPLRFLAPVRRDILRFIDAITGGAISDDAETVGEQPA